MRLRCCLAAPPDYVAPTPTPVGGATLPMLAASAAGSDTVVGAPPMSDESQATPTVEPEPEPEPQLEPERQAPASPGYVQAAQVTRGMEAEHSTAVSALVAEVTSTLVEGLSARHQQTLSKAQEQHAATVQALSSEAAQQKTAHAQLLARTESAHSEARAELQEEHTAAMASLGAELVSQNG
jgi:hypothetical protein